MKKILSLIVVLALSLAILPACSSGGNEKNAYKVYAPDGAPALALGKLIAENEQFGEEVSYNIVTANTIGQEILKNADVGILPVNAASLLFGDGSKFKAVGVVTHGNLYIASKDEITGIADLKGKTVAVAGKGNFMDLTLRLVLKNNDIETDAAAGVKIEYYSAASDIIPAMVQGKVSVALLPEPAVSSAKANAKTGITSVLDLQNIYGGGYPQAVLVMSLKTLENKAFVTAFVNALKENGTYLTVKENVDKAVDAINKNMTDKGLTASLDKTKMTVEVVARSNIRFSPATSEKDKITAYVSGLKSINPESVKDLSDAFFYLG